MGRDQELAHLVDLIAQARLITLVGPGGVGKTRLAVHVAVRALADHPGGAWFVDLSLITEARLVIQAVASALGVCSSTGERLFGAVTTHLARKSVLLVLDNCEHVLHACAELVCQLLPECGNLRILATSREELGVIGEVAWTVPPLRLPRGDSPGEVAGSEAVRLFLARSGTGAELSETTAAVVARICRRLDGLPLAIELAASRIGDLTFEEVESNLDKRFQLLRTDRIGMPKRQQTLLTSLEWSYDLIPEAERALLRRAAVFAGPFTAAAAAQVCEGNLVGGDDVSRGLSGLVAKSLLVKYEDAGHLQYRMLESVRYFAQEKLGEAGEYDAMQSAHAQWCAALATRSDAGPLGLEETRNAPRLEDIHADLRAALAWSADHNPGLGLALAADLCRFWVSHGHLEEGRSQLQGALTRTSPTASARAKALWGSGLIACLLGDFPTVGPAVEEGLALARRGRDEPILARLLNLVGVTRIFTDPPAAINALEESTRLARHQDEIITLVSSLALLGFARTLCGDLESARLVLEHCLSSGENLGEGQPMVMGLVGLGHVLVHQGNQKSARTCLDSGLLMARRIGNPIWAALALAFQAELESIVGEHQRARSLAGEAVSLARETHAAPVVCLCLTVAGTLEVDAGDPASSIAMLDEALTLCVVGEAGGIRARTLLGQGRAKLDLGNSDAAQVILEEAVVIAEAEQNRAAVGAALHHLARCASFRNDHEAALGLNREALVALNRAGHRVAIPSTVEALASATAQEGDVAKAVRLIAAAEALRKRIEAPRTIESRAYCDLVETLAKKELGSDEQREAALTGANFPTERLVTYATAGKGPRKRPSFGWLSLTPTELQVIDLVAEGLTNTEIGKRLLMGAGTVKTHLAHVYRKLGIASRADVVATLIHRRSCGTKV